ncbi:hypothetical protein ACH42_10355 [Endozoicomonas sp. (ex Bugula neritina AB1)]|nr:hypothetical protein ACH42_10355 [Endozoicomonas sp. (ex Bugula neritina AB1)]
MIDDNKKYIFVENPKTATYSIKHALMGVQNVHNPFDHRIATVNHATPEVIRSKYPEKWENYTTFVVVRNTWDRAHSFFHFYRHAANSKSYQSIRFEDWVDTGCPPPKESHLRAPMHNEGRFDDTLCQLRYIKDVDEIIELHSFNHQKRCQELQTGLDHISSRLNIQPTRIPENKNNYGRSSHPVIWQKKTVHKLKAQYQTEVERFGFEAPEL